MKIHVNLSGVSFMENRCKGLIEIYPGADSDVRLLLQAPAKRRALQEHIEIEVERFIKHALINPNSFDISDTETRADSQPQSQPDDTINTEREDIS